jgi:hypothetical protein
MVHWSTCSLSLSLVVCPGSLSPDYERPMFDLPLRPTAKFDEQDVDSSWGQSGSMQPMFAAALNAVRAVVLACWRARLRISSTFELALPVDLCHWLSDTPTL